MGGLGSAALGSAGLMLAGSMFCGLMFCGLMFCGVARAQEGAEEAATPDTVSQGQVWLGYLTQTRLSEELSLWNDAHFVPEAFYILRTGVSVHLPERVVVTAGYAFLGLPVGTVTRDLDRREHRPWAQLVYPLRLGDEWGLSNRLRYDARIQRNVEDGEIAPGYGFVNRGRWMLTLRRELPELGFGDGIVPYASVGNEVLVAWDGEGTRLDQNRITAGLGATRRSVALQVSYMNRFVQVGSGRPSVMNHTLVVWVFHEFDLRGD